MLPYRRRGYAVERGDPPIVHERWAVHAPGARRTPAIGLERLLGDRAYLACELCFGPVPADRAPDPETGPSATEAPAPDRAPRPRRRTPAQPRETATDEAGEQPAGEPETMTGAIDESGVPTDETGALPREEDPLPNEEVATPDAG